MAKIYKSRKIVMLYSPQRAVEVNIRFDFVNIGLKLWHHNRKTQNHNNKPIWTSLGHFHVISRKWPSDVLTERQAFNIFKSWISGWLSYFTYQFVHIIKQCHFLSQYEDLATRDVQYSPHLLGSVNIVLLR
jgi:hypothetical protein